LGHDPSLGANNELQQTPSSLETINASTQKKLTTKEIPSTSWICPNKGIQTLIPMVDETIAHPTTWERCLLL
tara:strand:+ start:2090 stop:2305 length:216 start_codon:yes stop_codon:yes gene_type:complete